MIETKTGTITKSPNLITIPKEQFLRLQQQAKAYRSYLSTIFELPLKDPIDEVVADFRQTNLYSEPFLDDLEDGLRKSSYAKKYGN